MSLIDKIKISAISGILASSLFLNGCGVYREKNSRFSYCLIPFVGIAIKIEEYENSNKIKNATEILISRKGCDLKYYGENMEYQGLWRARTQKNSSKLLVSHYDSEGKLIKKQEGMPDDAPPIIMFRID